MAIKDQLNYSRAVADKNVAAEDVALRNNVTTMSANGTVKNHNGVLIIDKTSAAAITLGAPTASEDGLELKIVSDSAFAHVVTATALIEDGVTGGAKTTITLGAFKGASCTLVALNKKYYVLGKNVATIA